MMKLNTEEKKNLKTAYNLNSDISVDIEQPDVKLEPLHQDYPGLSYTCLVVPWRADHELRGDIKGTLPGWIQQVCISFEWQLEFITVNPRYLQWGIKVPPNISPAQFMNVFCKETSEIITTTFPRMKSEKLEHDFWAPGYLVINGIRPLPPELVRQFIFSVRRQQGLDK